MPRWLDAAGGAEGSAEVGSEPEQRLYRAPFDSVMAQRLTPGTKLPEVALGELFGVSRAVVREVLQRLAHDHIVQLRPNRGAIVAVPTAQDIRQLQREQDALQATTDPAIESASTGATAAAVGTTATTAAAADRRPGCAWPAPSTCVAALAHNPLLQRYLVETVSRCSLIVALHQAPGHAACEHDEHQRIFHCIAHGDAEGAARLMDEHLRGLPQHLALADPPARPARPGADAGLGLSHAGRADPKISPVSTLHTPPGTT